MSIAAGVTFQQIIARPTYSPARHCGVPADRQGRIGAPRDRLLDPGRGGRASPPALASSVDQKGRLLCERFRGKDHRVRGGRGEGQREVLDTELLEGADFRGDLLG